MVAMEPVREAPKWGREWYVSSGLLILSAYAPSTPPLLSLPLFMNANPSSPPESPNSFKKRKIREINTFLESFNLTAPPLERNSSCLEGDVGFVELYKEYEIGEFSEEEIKEEEEVAEVEEFGVEYFDKSLTRD
uniref:Uncharacterized protein n=1 Tax=Tanacetum cinerariifolium TaxID=118510 RepID=A0A699I3N4_TANCI|nr:hypothetical protein [Tanacetum cinerariifolium]